MFNVYRESGLFMATEQQLKEQARFIKNRGWLSHVEIEEINRRVERGENSLWLQNASNDDGINTTQNRQEQANRFSANKRAERENEYGVGNSNLNGKQIEGISTTAEEIW